MLHLKQNMSKKKRITIIGIASAVAVAAIALVSYYYPAVYETLINTVSNVFADLPNTFAVLSKDFNNAIAYTQSQLEQQLL